MRISSKWKETVLWSFIFFTVVGLTLFSQKRDYNNLKQHGKETVGIITEFGNKNSVHWEHRVDDEPVKIIDRNDYFTGLQIGETFIATYDSTYPVNAVINYSKPVINFTSDTTVNYRLIRPINVRNIYVSFSYQYNGQDFTRQQELPDNHNWEQLTNFKVVVNKGNPRIAYLIPAGETSTE